MAFFKMRKGGDDTPSAFSQPESVEAMRRRARHRLIGAAVLVVLGVVGFPLLFDTQPRPVAVDIPIEIPDRNKVKPLAPPATLPPPAFLEKKGAAAPVASASRAIKTEAMAESQADGGPALKPDPKLAVRAEPKAEARPAASAAEGAKAKALLEGKPAEPAPRPAAGEARFVVQVGSFANAAKAREMRTKVEKAGLKTFTHVTETKEGKRIRVRIGPFPTRADADKAADRIKGLDLPAAVLTL